MSETANVDLAAAAERLLHGHRRLINGLSRAGLLPDTTILTLIAGTDQIEAAVTALRTRTRPGPLPVPQLWPTQETMLHAAAVALRLAADGRITARGVLGSAVQPAPPRWAYAGDPLAPHSTTWPDLTAAAEAALDQARTETDAARQLLGLHSRWAAGAETLGNGRSPFYRTTAFRPVSCRMPPSWTGCWAQVSQ